MGVKGLWQLVSSSGTPVPLESLEQKILAVDVSIWLHQAVKGFKGFGGGSVANAHLLTLFHRICKLLFYRIRPVFVFDGGIPQLKRETISSRRLRREAAAGKAQKVRERLLANLLKSQAVRKALGKTGPGPCLYHVAKPVKKEKDLFELPPLTEDFTDPKLKNKSNNNNEVKEEEEEEEEEDYILQHLKSANLHNFELENESFRSLSLEAQHEILSQLQDTRKENSWGTINEMPPESTEFADFQMKRMLQRRKFQQSLDDIRTEIKKVNTAAMEKMLFGELEKHVSQTHRIVSEDASHSILISLNKEENAKSKSSLRLVPKIDKGKSLSKNVAKLDFLTELAKQGIVSKSNFKENVIETSLSSSDDDDDDSYLSPNKKDGLEEITFLKAMDYIFEDQDLTQEEIMALIKQSKMEVNSEIPKSLSLGNEKTSDKTISLHEPSTSASAPGHVYNSDSSSSDEDDFIDVTEWEPVNANNSNNQDISAMLSPLKQQFIQNGAKYVEKIATSSSKQISSQNGSKFGEKTNNVDEILATKTNSLYLKIVQQKLDDIVHESSNTKSLVDSRKSLPTQVLKKDDKKSVTISLDFIKNSKQMVSDDIFSDVFQKEVAVEKVKHADTSRCKAESLNHDKVVLQKADDNMLGKQNCNSVNKQPTMIRASLDSESSLNAKPPIIDMNSKPNVTEDLTITPELKEKLSELVKLEVEKLINASKSKTALIYETKDCSLNQDAEMKSVVTATCIKNKNDLPYVGEKDTLMRQTSTAVGYQQAQNSNNFDIIVDTPASSNEYKNEKIYSPSKYLEKNSPPSSDNSSKNAITGNVFQVPDEVEEETEQLDDCVSPFNSSTNGNFLSNKIGNSGKNESNQSGIVELEKPLKYTQDELSTMENQLASEQNMLVAQVHKVDKVARELSDQVYGEAQELLRLFGLPYLVAPMEAEAQCAFLDEVGLTHGTITDDSDIFLFGGTKVYKNFFNHSKHVELFKTENIFHNFGLNRNKMISLALLTGSDYTVGIESVGNVLGMEILSEFPGEGLECLKKFRKWWNVASKNVSASCQSKTKQRLCFLHLPDSFPNENIFKAYLNPDVDESREKFSWSVPSVEDLRNFAAERFGWNKEKTEEILIPVFKKLGVKDSQMRIDTYFNSIKLVKEPHLKSKRLKEAISRTKGEEIELTPPKNNKSVKDLKQVLNKNFFKSCRKPRGVLLADPSEGIYGPNEEGKKIQKRKIKLLDSESDQLPPNSKKRLVSSSHNENHNLIAGVDSLELTKEEQKSLIYKKLLEKDKILQKEFSRKESERKRALAVSVINKKSAVEPFHKKKKKIN